MALRDRLMDLEQRLKRVAREPEPTEPIEVRSAILRAVADMAQPAGRGRRVVPVDRIAIDVLAETPARRRLYDAVFDRDGGLVSACERALDAAAVAAPLPVIHVRFKTRRPATWDASQHFLVAGVQDAESREAHGRAAAAASAIPSAGALPRVTVRPVKGRTHPRVLDVQAARINIGRQEEVRDRDRRLVRRNDLAVVEGTPLAESVSRTHAHIRCLPSGECRVRDDHSAYGTRIVRSGDTIDVLPSNTRGVRLRSGDELHVGHVVLTVQIE